MLFAGTLAAYENYKAWIQQKAVMHLSMQPPPACMGLNNYKYIMPRPRAIYTYLIDCSCTLSRIAISCACALSDITISHHFIGYLITKPSVTISSTHCKQLHVQKCIKRLVTMYACTSSHVPVPTSIIQFKMEGGSNHLLGERGGGGGGGGPQPLQ